VPDTVFEIEFGPRHFCHLVAALRGQQQQLL